MHGFSLHCTSASAACQSHVAHCFVTVVVTAAEEEVPEHAEASDISSWHATTSCRRLSQTLLSKRFLKAFLHDCRGVDIKPDYANVASVVFSSPQVAQVGVNEDKAVEEYGDVDIFTSTFS